MIVAGIEVFRYGSVVRLDVPDPIAGKAIAELPPSEARQIANALLEAADEVEGRRP